MHLQKVITLVPVVAYSQLYNFVSGGLWRTIDVHAEQR